LPIVISDSLLFLVYLTTVEQRSFHFENPVRKINNLSIFRYGSYDEESEKVNVDEMPVPDNSGQRKCILTQRQRVSQ